jgi:hypothetical protein
MIYVFDLDGTLCHTVGREYQKATPRPERIAHVNDLFDAGHTILIDSARGSKTGIDWLPLTRRQLADWGVKHHDVRTGVKWYADIYVDDRGYRDTAFFQDPDGDY